METLLSWFGISVGDEDDFGEYTLGKTLGKGSFGTVRMAEHTPSGKHFAVKVVSSGKMDRNSLDREISNQRRLDHPNIVKIHDVIEMGGNVSIAMEYVPFEFFDYVLGMGKLKETEARTLFVQIINAVSHCHDSMIVHRDLKPENLLLDHENNVKLTDFGLSAEWHVGEFLTDSCGSPNYASPEMMQKECKYEGPEVDIWSCGVILYVLLTNELPFDADDLPSLFRLIKKGRYNVPGYISSDARDLIGHMVDIDSYKRFSFDEVRSHTWFENGTWPAVADSVGTQAVDSVAAQAVDSGEAHTLKSRVKSAQNILRIAATIGL